MQVGNFWKYFPLLSTDLLSNISLSKWCLQNTILVATVLDQFTFPRIDFNSILVTINHSNPFSLMTIFDSHLLGVYPSLSRAIFVQRTHTVLQYIFSTMSENLSFSWSVWYSGKGEVEQMQLRAIFIDRELWFTSKPNEGRRVTCFPNGWERRISLLPRSTLTTFQSMCEAISYHYGS